jgi:ribosome maturation protein SDO1
MPMYNILSDKEKVEISTARLKSRGHDFEVVIDADLAIKFRHGETTIEEALKAQHVFKDAQKGETAGATLLKEVFGTEDELAVAAKIIKEGEIHFDEAYREKLRSDKRQQIIAILARDAAEANTGNPVSAQRLIGAFSQAKINLDLFKKAEEQVPDVIQKLKSVLMLTLERKIINIRLPASHAAKLYGSVASKARIIEEAWLGDGSWSCRAELAAGQTAGMIDELKKATHGEAEINIEAKKK